MKKKKKKRKFSLSSQNQGKEQDIGEKERTAGLVRRFVRSSVRDLVNFTEGYMHFGHVRVRLGKILEICPRFWKVTLTNCD